MLTGRSPDSRRVLKDRPHRLPTGDSGSGRRACLRDAACAVYRCGGSAGMASDSRTGFPINPGSRPGYLSSRAILGRRHRAGQAAVDEAVSPTQCGRMANSPRLETALAGASAAAGADSRELSRRHRGAREAGRLARDGCRHRGGTGDPRPRAGALSRGRFLRRGIRGGAHGCRTCLDRGSDRRHQVLRAPLPDVLDADRGDAPRSPRARRFLRAGVRRDGLGRARRRRLSRRRAPRRQPHRHARERDASRPATCNRSRAGHAGRPSAGSSRASTASAASATSSTTTCSRRARSRPSSSPISTSKTSRRSQ